MQSVRSFASRGDSTNRIRQICDQTKTIHHLLNIACRHTQASHRGLHPILDDISLKGFPNRIHIFFVHRENLLFVGR